jgi:hypothetical protein
MTHLLAILIVAGIGLLGVGLRGRRVGSEPVCARCGYDLTGRAAGSEVCSECGTPLNERSIRIGRRRRRPVVAAMGLLLLLPAITVAVFIGSGKAAEVDWQAYKPLSWLRMEARDKGTPAARAAFAEITRRMKDGALNQDQIDELVEEAMRHQLDRASEWDHRWGELVELARSQGKVTDERWTQYAGNGLCDISVSVRPRVRHGDPFVIGMAHPPWRYGNNSLWSMPHLKVGVGPYPDLSETFGGSRSTLRLDRAQWQQISPGVTSVHGTLKIKAIPAGSDPRLAGVAEREVAVNLPVEVLPPDVPSVRAVKDETLRQAMEAAVAVGPIRRSPNGAVGCAVYVLKAPAGVAYSVHVLTDDAEVELSGTATAAAGVRASFGCSIGNPPSPVRGSTASIRLRPSARAAVATLDVEDYWDGEIQIHNVPVINEPYSILSSGDARYFANGTVVDPIGRTTTTRPTR